MMHKGFVLIDILIAIAVLMIISPAYMQYVFSFDVSSYIDRYIQKPEYTYQVDIAHENCDMFFSSIFKDGDIDMDMVHIDEVGIQDGSVYAYQDIQESTMTAIEFFGKTQYGQNTVFIGLNSASTSVPDMGIFKYDDIRHIVHFEHMFSLGPGVIGMDLYPKIYDMRLYIHQENGTYIIRPTTKHIGAIERSIVTPFWIISNQREQGSSTMILSPYAPALNLLGAYPQVVKIYGNRFIIGTQKSIGPELISGTIEPGTTNIHLSDQFEIGSGVNDITMLSNRILFASPQNPELDQVLLSSSSIVDIHDQNMYIPISSIDRFDAPGELGNGKSLVVHPFGLFLGRTAGNQELYSIFDIEPISNSKSGDIKQFHISSANPNSSIRKMIYVHDGFGVIAMTNSDTDAIKIYVHKKEGEIFLLEEKASFDIPAKPTDMVCVQDAVLVTTESTTTPLMVIYGIH